MSDKVTLDRIQLLHPKVRDEVKNIYLNEIIPALSGKAICRFAYTLRTFAEQDALYAQGRTRLFDGKGKRLGIVTKAKGGQSIHNYGFAVDIVLIIDGKTASWDIKKDWDKDGVADWDECVKVFAKYGWNWGGNWSTFKDMPHFDKIGFNNWRVLINKSKDSQGYVNI
jgi:peptidoglycan L-alanyl-D-glutamate endopeptidase CwlK